MASNEKDVSLVIRAKDQSERIINSVADAFKTLAEIQDRVTDSAKKTDTVLGQLSDELGKLDDRAKGLGALSSVATQMDKAANAVSRLQSEVTKSTTEIATLSKSASDAESNTARLKTEAEAAAKAFRDQADATTLAKTAQTAANRELRSAETVLQRLEQRLARAKAPSDALKAQVAGQQQAVNSLRVAQQTAITNFEAQKNAQDAAAKSLRQLRADISASEGNERKIAAAAADAAIALERQSAGLAKAETGLSEIAGLASKASAALGGVALTQDAIAAASKSAADEITKVNAALAVQKGTIAPGVTATASQAPERTVAGYKAQVAAVREAQAAWKDAVAESNRLAAAIKSTEKPTLDQQRAFLLAQAASKAAKTEYLAQGAALGQLRGVANSSFAAFDQAARQMVAAGNESAVAADKLAQSGARAAGSQRDIAPAARGAGAALGSAAGEANGYKAALEGVYGESRKAMSLLQRFRGEVLSLTAGWIGLQSSIGQLGGVVNAVQVLQTAQTRLGVVFNQDTGKIQSELAFLREQADRLGISFGTLADQYTKFAVAAHAANFTTDATRRIFISVAEAARVNNLNVQETEGIFLALTQMISKGKVAAQELRQQLGERLPGAFTIFAKAIGVSTSALDKMMSDGEVLASQDNLLKFANELNNQFGPQLAASLRNITTQIGRLQNNIFNAQLDVANGGFIAQLNSALAETNSFLESDNGRQFFQELGAAVGRFVQVLALVPQHFNEIKLAVEAFVAVKIGGVLTEIATRSIAATRAVGGLSKEMQFVGPQARSMTLAQRILGQGFAQTISVMDAYRASLLASTSATVVARTGVLGFAASLGVIRATMIGAATVARTLWAAIGGVPGLILTGITFALGSWLTSIDNTNVALDEHKRQLQAIIEGYDTAKDKAGDWAQKINGVTLAQAVKNADDLHTQLNRAIGDADSLSRLLVYAFQDFPAGTKQAAQLQEMTSSIAKLKAGTITLKNFSEVMNQIALNPVDQQFKDIALQILDMINVSKDGAPSLLDLADAVDKADAKTRLLAGTATEADKALLGIGDAAKKSASDTDQATFSLQTYTDAIDKLKEKIPALNEQLKSMKEFAEIDASSLQAFAQAVASGDMTKIAEVMNLYAQARKAVQADMDHKILDALPGNDSIIDRIINVESGGNPFAKASTSSAVGVGQFTESTWLGLFNKVFPELTTLNETAKLALRTNEEASRKMLDALTKENQSALMRAGLDPSARNTYLAHFLGANDAIKVLLANPEELAANIVQKQSVNANPSVFKPGTTVQDLLDFSTKKMGGGAPILAGGQTSQEQFDAGLKLQIDGYKQEAAARAESNREGEIAKGIAAAQAEATKNGATLTKEETAALREAIGAKYDSLHAGEALKQQRQEEQSAIQNLVGLDQQRATTLKALQDAMKEGDQDQVATLRQQIADLNVELAKGVPLAEALARALGDEKGIATLSKITLHAKELSVELTNAKEINNMLAEGLTSAFSSAAESIAGAITGAQTWGDAILGVRDAFLKFASDFLIQIGEMILKQLILNMLSSAFGGATGGLGGAIAGAVNALVKHDGGQLHGGRTRMIPAAAFAGAQRLHSGGIPGLKSTEVATILERNEEVLKRDDPRHVLNGGKSADGSSGNQDQAGGASRALRNILVFDPADIAAAMAGSAGDDVIVNFIKRNAPTVRRLIGA